LYDAIKRFLDNNYKEMINKIDEETLMKEIPSTHREELIFYQYG